MLLKQKSNGVEFCARVCPADFSRLRALVLGLGAARRGSKRADGIFHRRVDKCGGIHLAGGEAKLAMVLGSLLLVSRARDFAMILLQFSGFNSHSEATQQPQTTMSALTQATNGGRRGHHH